MDSFEEELAKAYKEIANLKAQIAELEHGQMKKENTQLRRLLLETNKNYVEVVNENLNLKRNHG